MRNIFLLIPIIFLFACTDDRSINVDKMKFAELFSAQIEVGQTQAEILRMLSHDKIEHSTPTRINEPISAIIRDVESADIVTSSYSMQFSFDDVGKLIKYSHELVHTGP